MDNTIRIYKSSIHFGEEPLILGNEKAGMICFSGCMLACKFCYTPETSQFNLGKDYTAEEFFKLSLELLRKGAKNLNLITPSHLWSRIEKPLSELKQWTNGNVPIVLKIGGFETLPLLARMATLSNVFVTDFKVWSQTSAIKAGLPANYGKKTLDGIAWLNDNFPFLHDNISRKLSNGTLVRHLLMPGFEEDSKAIIEKLAAISFKGPVNLMTRFLDPDTHCLTDYPETQVNHLIDYSRHLNVTVLINGFAP